MKMVAEGKVKMDHSERPVLFMFPNGQWCGDVDYNPFGMFHDLSRKSAHNHWYMHPRYQREAT